MTDTPENCGEETNRLRDELLAHVAAILEENQRLRKRAVPPKELPRYTDPPDICPTCDTRSFISDGPMHYVCYNCHNTKLLEEAEEENQRLAKELERFKALEAHLPKGYAIGDDATAELAVEMGKMREELLKVAEDAGPFMQPYFEELRKAVERWK